MVDEDLIVEDPDEEGGGGGYTWTRVYVNVH